MGELFLLEQGTLFLEPIDDFPIRFKDKFPGKVSRIRGKFALGIHRGRNLESITLSRFVVLLTVARCDVHTTGPLILGHEVSKDDFYITVAPRVATPDPLKLVTGPCPPGDLVIALLEAERLH